MASQGTCIVVDIGKTMSKVTLWSAQGALLDRKVRANAACESGGLRRLDVNGIGEWLLDTLASHAGHPIEAVVPVAHGAGVVALEGSGLAFAPLDYEQALPEAVMASYRGERDPFSVTGSPPLPDGLNMGSQLYWMEQLHPQALAGSKLVPWAQYWAWFLSGKAVSEVTSLGCHSDIWDPVSGAFAPLARRMGWDKRFAPVVSAGTTVGTIRPDIGSVTGLPAETRILAGLHDSNAALLAARGFAEIADNEATVLSTGTWFIAMRLAKEPVSLATLPEARDCLVNVDAYGQPVPSARFMGGREIETLIEIDTRRIDIKPDQPALLAAVPDVIRNNAMVLPNLAPGCGPYPHNRHRWMNCPEDAFERRTAASLYAALVADTTLDLIGSKERLLVEGRFAEAEVFVRALASLRPDMAVYTANAHNDVSFGAIRLINPSLAPQGQLHRIRPLDCDLVGYRAQWRAETEAMA